MAELLIRNVDDATLVSLTKQAEQHGRTLDSELKEILRQAAVEPNTSMAEARRAIEEFRRKIGANRQTDSTELLAEDRAR